MCISIHTLEDLVSIGLNIISYQDSIQQPKKLLSHAVQQADEQTPKPDKTKQKWSAILKTNFWATTWWRGQSKASWGLVPKVLRANKQFHDEPNLIMRFRMKAPIFYSGCPGDEDLGAWLFLMQHYGLPTRLLDWTESPLIAAFFAVQGNKDDDAALWALEPGLLNMQQFNGNECNVLSTNDQVIVPQLKEAFGERKQRIDGREDTHNAAADHCNLKRTDCRDRIMAILPNQVDSRMQLQLGGCTIHGTRKPLNETEGKEKFLRKFIIPAKYKEEFKEGIYKLGIRMSNVFPDLEHLAQELARRG